MNQVKKILKGIPEKQGRHKNTTSLKWKKDLIEFFIIHYLIIIKNFDY